MSTAGIIILIGVLVAIAVVAWALLSKRHTERLRTRFGPEYDHTVDEVGSRRKAEAELARREERVGKLPIRSLSESERVRFLDAWRACQAHFVDNPGDAVEEADRLCAQVMKARGYPMSDFDQRAADLSVEHPQVVDNYRSAHDIAVNQSFGQASTEDLRRAMVHYRTSFEDLLGARADERVEVRR